MSDTRRWVHHAALEKVGACERGECTHWHIHPSWPDGGELDKTLCLHFASEKSLTRDREPFNSGKHRFSHGQRNSLENLLEKNRQLSLREALDENFVPRMRKNHSRPYDNTREWDRMIRHSEATRWQYPYCPNNRDHCVTGYSYGDTSGWECLSCCVTLNEKD